MESHLTLDILPQPDETTCGPTCLHAVYRYFGDGIPLESVIEQTESLEEGGTLAVLLGTHALKRGYSALIYTYNLVVFDPTWFKPPSVDLEQRLALQARIKESKKLRRATRAYIEFLEKGGLIRLEDLTAALIRRYLKRGVPILTGLSATYLYGSRRERLVSPASNVTEPDDVSGTPVGHFVVLCGYDASARNVLVADPWRQNPASGSDQYWVGIDRLVNSILLGIVTYDANLLILERKKSEPHSG